MPRVLINGDGVAARCTALLLARAGFDVLSQTTPRPRLPAIMLSDAAISLIETVWERRNLFDDAPRVRKRIVSWGNPESPAVLEHSATVVTEQQLLDALGALPGSPHPTASPDFTIVATNNLAQQSFGSRRATASPVILSPRAEPGACWIESLESGWLFLIATEPGQGWLLTVGNPGKGRLIVPRIEEAAPPIGAFPASPRLAETLTGPDWLACGSAAMAFDPLCGDGTAHAIREAILCAAVIKAMARGGDAASLRTHYESRLIAGFRKHLENCLPFYRTGAQTPWWQNEAIALRRGLERCEGRIAPFRYRLSDFDLEPLS